MPIRLSTPLSGPEPPAICGVVAREAVALLLQAPQQLASLLARVAAAAPRRADQVAELELGRAAGTAAGGVGELSRRVDQAAADGLQLAGVARAGHAGRDLRAVDADGTGRCLQRGPHGVRSLGAGRRRFPVAAARRQRQAEKRERPAAAKARPNRWIVSTPAVPIPDGLRAGTGAFARRVGQVPGERGLIVPGDKDTVRKDSSAA